MDPPEGQRFFPDCGHLGNVHDDHRFCFNCREKIGQCTVEHRCPTCNDWIPQWFEDVSPRHTLSNISMSHSSTSVSQSLSRPCLPVMTTVNSNKEPKKRSSSGSRGTNSINFNKKLLEKISDSKGKPGKGTEKTDKARKSSLNSTELLSREKSQSRMKSPTSQSADGSMTARREKPTTHLPQDIAPAIPVMSGKKGSTTQVSGHVGRMKANMCPLTESKRTHTAQGTTLVSGHVACPLTESQRTHTSLSTTL